jgi:hypothetical protein
MLLYLQPPL